MRILTISHMFPSLDNERHGIFICRQAQALRRHGIEMCFLVGRPWAPWPLCYARRWRSYRTAPALIVPGGFSARPVRYVRPPGLWFRRFDGRSLALSLQGPASKWHKQEPFDMVMGVSMLPDAETAVIIGRRLAVPVATLAVGSDVMVYPGRLPALRKHLARTLAQVALPLGVSESICRKLAQAGACKRQPLCTYLARDESGFGPASDKEALRATLGWSTESVIGLYVGGLVQSKGLGDLIAAARPLLATHDRFRVVCLGDGPLRTDLAEAGCVLPGRVRPEEVARYLQAADFLILPSHSEGMPQAILEAMDCGLPIVATNVGGIPEAVLDGQTGLLVEPGSIDDLRNAIRRMITDTEFRIEAGRRSLERARTVFDSQRNTEVLAQALKEVVANPVGGAPHTNDSAREEPKEMVCSAHPTTTAKVCIVTTVHDVFDGRIFHKQAKSLAQAGYHVVLIARNDRAEVVDGVRLVPLREPHGRFDRMTGLMRRALTLALQEDADVYHFHDPELIRLGLALKRRGKKVIWDVHEHYPNSIRDKFYIPRILRSLAATAFDLYERAAVRSFDHIIYTTPEVGARYAKMKVPSTSIENYPIVELAETVEPDRQERMIYLGAMSRIRGLTQVIEAFGRIVKEHPSWQLDLVGSCRPAGFEAELRALAKDQGAESNVNFIPPVPYQEKEKLTARASMGLVTYLPYANNTSCLPNKLFDYMLMGLPVIASNFLQYRKVVETHRCGLIVDPAKPEEIAHAMLYLIEHPEEASQMGRNGRQAVVERYNWDTQSHKLLSIYSGLLRTNVRGDELVGQRRS